MATAISVQQLSVRFGGRRPVHALHPLDLAVDRGRIVGVLGPNGSGKTTLLRALAGLQPISGGTARILDLPPGHPELRRRFAFQPEGALPFGVLSAPEFLAWVGARLGLPNADADERAARWLARLDLEHAGRRWLRTFSTGMQKRLALAAALLGDPEVLLLDEPTAGLDPAGSATVIEILREYYDAVGIAAAGMLSVTVVSGTAGGSAPSDDRQNLAPSFFVTSTSTPRSSGGRSTSANSPSQARP